MKNKIILLFTVFTVTFSLSCFSQNNSNSNSEASTLLWEVRPKNDTNKVMFLFGSIHIGIKEMYPLSPIIMDAWSKSDVLGVEFDIENFELSDFGPDLQSKLISFTEKLHTKLPTVIYEKLKLQLIENGIPEFTVDYFTPLGAALVLELGNIMAAIQNIDDENNDNIAIGIDKYFLKLAAKENKEIIEVESLQRQIQVLEEMNEFIVDYISALLERIEKESSDDDIINLFSAWISGDVEALEKIINTEYSSDSNVDAKLKDALLFKRNIEITEKIEEYFLDSRTFFIVIGAGHFVGENSIIYNLEKTEKYIIRRF